MNAFEWASMMFLYLIAIRITQESRSLSDTGKLVNMIMLLAVILIATIMNYFSVKV